MFQKASPLLTERSKTSYKKSSAPLTIAIAAASGLTLFISSNADSRAAERLANESASVFESSSVPQSDASLEYSLETQTESSVRLGDQLWIIDRISGTLRVVNAAVQTPLWSKNGVVYKSTKSILNDSERFVAPTPPRQPLNSNPKSACKILWDVPQPFAVEIDGRVYVVFSEVESLSRSNKKKEFPRYYLCAFDGRSQGRLVWQIDAERLRDVFPSHSVGPSRSAVVILQLPRKISGDKLLLPVSLEKQTYEVLIDAATGVIIQ